MKIDRSFHTAKRKQSHEGAGETGSTRNRRFTRRGDTGSDRVEISTQAKERYENEQKAQKVRSASKEYITAMVNRSESSLARERLERVKNIKEDLHTGRYEIDDAGKLKTAADKITSQLLYRSSR